MNSIKFNKLTVSSASVGLTNAGFTAAEIVRAHHAVVTIDGADIRYRDDGTAPDATTGHLIYDGGGIEWLDHPKKYDQELNNLAMIRDASADAVASITLYD